MPTIQPSDPSYQLHTWVLTILSALSVKFLLAPLPSDNLTLLRVICTLILPTITFTLLSNRHITLQRVAALRLSHTCFDFSRAMENKTILTADGMGVIFKMLLSTAMLSNLPIAYERLMQGNTAEWIQKVGRPASWFFAAVNMTIVLVCWAMVITQEEMRFEFEEGFRIGDEEVALEKLKSAGKKEGWKKVASTSRRHDVYVKSVRLPNGDDIGVYELSTRLATNHPLYNADNDEKPSGPILRIALP
ncbi:uncharacterized protein UTRI_02136_B [Ustilago trichophora]|uniref:Uncharacterized protein n=1 Tax=Ustilago trichophora TaxID=86804 RepID=A0A5C3DY13_9BASI|nr:uncharacterized protein UTRI_02136_B [Ustilago trichophora]